MWLVRDNLSHLLAETLPAPLGAWAMARNLLEVKSKTSTLAGILCNIEDKEEGVKGGENSDNKNHMVAQAVCRKTPATPGLLNTRAFYKTILYSCNVFKSQQQEKMCDFTIHSDNIVSQR